MKVADFFCGAGGFSEGFRQMGFEIVFGLDKWAPAIETVKLNHPGINAVCMDILDLKTPKEIDKMVPDVDIIIGSPPCVAFSNSNKSKKADKRYGISLIEQYLKIIAWKKNKPKSKLRYWILENVPHSSSFMKDNYTFDDLGLRGGKKIALNIQNKNILDSSDYGVPQHRIRLFCGEYPLLIRTYNKQNWMHTSHVLEYLTDPLKKNEFKIIKDPCYDLEIRKKDMTDHFYDSRIADWKWQRAKSLKEDHGFMGRMSFPEDLDRPCRTIMATRSTSSRETMIFGAKKKGGRYLSYRLPTIREIASIMSFPITYQFEANNEASKYKLVGNAVCPLQARALAEAIAEEEDMIVPNNFIPVKNYQKVSYDLTGLKRKKQQKCPKIWSTKFARHIPYLKIRGFRVELDNKKSDFKNNKIIWSSVLHQGQGKNAFKCECASVDIEKLINKSLFFDKELFDEFKKDIIKLIDEKVPLAEQLQKGYCNMENSNQNGPNEILTNIRLIVDDYFSEKEYFKAVIKNYNDIIEIPRQDIPLRIIMGYYALNKVVENINM